MRAHQIFDACLNKLTEVQTFIPRYLTKAHNNMVELLANLEKTKGMINAKFTEISDELVAKLGKILGERKPPKPASAKGQLTVQQSQTPPPKESNINELNSDTESGIVGTNNETASLSARPAASGLSLAEFGTFSLASRQDTLDLWNQALKSKALSSHPKGNAYQKFLKQLESGAGISNIDKGLLEDAFGAVSAKYTSLLRAKHEQGLMLDVGDGPVHHWNYNKVLYPQDLVEPRNLVMTRDRSHHMEIHRATTSGHITKSPASPPLAG